MTTANAAYQKASVDKAAAEKVAIEAAAAAQKATLAKLNADLTLADATAAMEKLTAKVTRLKAASTANPEDTTLAQAVVDTEKEAAVAATAMQTAKTTADAATKVAADEATKANAAAAQAVAMSKPFTDALAALRQAQAAESAAAKTTADTAQAAKAATDLVPGAKAEYDASEARLAQVKAALDAANLAVTEAEKPLRSVAFSPDQRLLATGGDFAAIHTWDTETGAAVESFQGHAQSVRVVAFTPDGDIVSGAADNTAVVWDQNPGWVLERTIGSIGDPTQLVNRVVALDFSPDGSLLCTGGGDPSRSGEIKLWNVADGSLAMNVPDPHTDSVFGVEFSRDGRLVASASADKYVRAFDVLDGKLVQQFEGHTNHVLGVSWRGDGKVLASCGADSTIRIWDALTGDQLRVVDAAQGYDKQVTAIDFIGESVTTISCSGDTQVRMHNSDNGAAVRNFAGATDFMYTVAATPNGQVVVAGGYDSVLRVWNGANAQVLYTLEPPAPEEQEATEDMDDAESKEAAK
jgi:WD40 repeat protein